MKIIEIELCEHCPLKDGILCRHPTTEGNLIDTYPNIPTWCPLKDKEN